MLNKNDPLIGAVQEVMKRNQAEREAAKLVNEKFGIHDRKALPHERQHEWDAAYKTVLTEGVEALDEDYDPVYAGMANQQQKYADEDEKNRKREGKKKNYINQVWSQAAKRSRKKAITGMDEEVDSLDEVLDTDEKKMEYAKKASDQIKAHAERGGAYDMSSKGEKEANKIERRTKGLQRLLRKMQKEEALDEAKIDHPNKRKLDVAEPYGELTSDDFRKLRAMKEEEQIDEAGMMPQGKIAKKILAIKAGMKARKAEKRAWDDRGMMGPGPDFAKDRDEMLRMRKVKARLQKEETLEERKMTSPEKTKEEKLKAKLDTSGMKASMKNQYGKKEGEKIYFATIRKKAMKKDNEGFNNRHGLSVTASAEKQAVADQLLERVGNPLLLNRAKARARLGDAGVRRPISGTNNLQTRLANMRKNAPALDTTRDVSLDRPTTQSNMAIAQNRIQNRTALAQSTKDLRAGTNTFVAGARAEAKRRRMAGEPVLKAADVPGINRSEKAIQSAQQQSDEIMAASRAQNRTALSQTAKDLRAGTNTFDPKTKIDARAQGARVGTSSLAKPSGATAQPYGMNVPKKLDPDSRIAKGNVAPQAPIPKERPAAPAPASTQTARPAAAAPAAPSRPAKPAAAAPAAPSRPATTQAPQSNMTPAQRSQFNRQIDRGNAAPGTAYKGLGVTTGTTIQQKPTAPVSRPVGTGRQK